jgi:hypothetical protein
MRVQHTPLSSEFDYRNFTLLISQAVNPAGMAMQHMPELLRKGHFLGAKLCSLRKRNGLTEELSVRCIQRSPARPHPCPT